MTAAEVCERSAIVAEARTWIGTPFHHEGEIKGIGVDCAMLVRRVFLDTGVRTDAPDPRPYSAFGHLHKHDERYVDYLAPRTREVSAPLPGDIAVWRYGRAFSHAAIVSAWPRVVHAYAPVRHVEESDATIDSRLRRYPVRFFSPWGML